VSASADGVFIPLFQRGVLKGRGVLPSFVKRGKGRFQIPLYPPFSKGGIVGEPLLQRGNFVGNNSTAGAEQGDKKRRGLFEKPPSHYLSYNLFRRTPS